MINVDIDGLVPVVVDEVRSWPWELTVAVLVLLAFGASFAGIMAYSTRIELLRPVFAVLAAVCATAFVVVIFCVGFQLVSTALEWLHGVLSSIGGWMASRGLRL